MHSTHAVAETVQTRIFSNGLRDSGGIVFSETECSTARTDVAVHAVLNHLRYNNNREIDMINYQQRDYYSELGRWINRDPIEEDGGENLYAFCENDAISKHDALGRNVTLTTGNRNASWWQVGNRFYHQEICVDTWSWNPKSCCWRKSGRSCYSFAATGFGFGGPGSDW